MNFLRYLRLARSFRIDSKKGHLQFKGERIIITPAGMYGKVYDRLTEVVGKGGAAGALYLATKESSKSIYKLAQKMYKEEDLKSEANFGKIIEDFMSIAGYGKVEVVKIDFEKPEAIIRMRGLLTPGEINKSDVPVCHIERGVLTGFIECVTQKSCNGREVKCQAMGDEYCEFVITSAK